MPSLTLRRQLAAIALAATASSGMAVVAIAPSPASAVCSISDSLRTGSTGDGVRCVQATLNARGFDAGPVDGQFGPMTYRAVVAYQQRNGLGVDGVVGPQTGGSLGIWGTSTTASSSRSTTTPASAGAGAYTVASGDSLYAIAAKTGTPIDTLLSLNGLTLTSLIHPGQELQVSGSDSGTAAPTTSAPPSAPRTTTPQATGAYTVVSGDSLYGIAAKSGTSIDTLLSLNGLSLTSLIHPGQELQVSGSDSSTAAPTTSAPPATAPPDTATYRIVSGDSLYGIASKTATPIDTLLSLNGLSLSSTIFPGQELRVSGSSGSSSGSDASDGASCTPPAGVPAAARQVLVVNSSGSTADVDLLVRDGSQWTCARMNMYGRVGHNGVRALAQRRSGDGTTPAGIFPLGTMTAPDGQTFQFFGNGANPGVPGTWRQVESGDCWVATPGAEYNSLVSRSESECQSPDEYFPNFQNAYSRAALIAANMGPDRSGDQSGEPPLAAAIFLHHHSYDANGNTRPTSGCVSLSGENLDAVLRELVPGEASFVIR